MVPDLGCIIPEFNERFENREMKFVWKEIGEDKVFEKKLHYFFDMKNQIYNRPFPSHILFKRNKDWINGNDTNLIIIFFFRDQLTVARAGR